MSHADTLRGMADGQPIPWNTPVALDTRQDALLAAADRAEEVGTDELRRPEPTPTPPGGRSS